MYILFPMLAVHAIHTIPIALELLLHYSSLLSRHIHRQVCKTRSITFELSFPRDQLPPRATRGYLLSLGEFVLSPAVDKLSILAPYLGLSKVPLYSSSLL
jgi:hypothetical protein